MSDTEARDNAPARRRAVPKKSAGAPSLAELVSREDYQLANAHLFPSGPSLNWFIRRHRPELLRAGALLELAGRLVIDAQRFSEVVREVGRSAANRERALRAG
jgi:hypothetical protein